MLSTYWYDPESRQVQTEVDLEDLPNLLQKQDGVIWLDLCTPTEDEIAVLIEHFHFHPLCMEDCVHSQAVPKLEEFPDYLFLVVHGVRQTQKATQYDLVELDLFLGKNYIVTIHEEALQSIDFVRGNIERGTSAIFSGEGALAHEILDAMVDLYTPVLENLDFRLQELEDLIEENPGSDIVKDFFELRRSILQLRRISLKEQEVFFWLSHRDIAFISQKEALLFRDVHDHLVRVVELSEASRDILSGILNIHLSLMSNRMNDVMRILTIFSAILLPLNFIAGIYGMNFDHMPELRNPMGYYTVLTIMATITMGMLIFFRHKRWL